MRVLFFILLFLNGMNAVAGEESAEACNKYLNSPDKIRLRLKSEGGFFKLFGDFLLIRGEAPARISIEQNGRDPNEVLVSYPHDLQSEEKSVLRKLFISDAVVSVDLSRGLSEKESIRELTSILEGFFTDTLPHQEIHSETLAQFLPKLKSKPALRMAFKMIKRYQSYTPEMMAAIREVLKDREQSIIIRFLAVETLEESHSADLGTWQSFSEILETSGEKPVLVTRVIQVITQSLNFATDEAQREVILHTIEKTKIPEQLAFLAVTGRAESDPVSTKEITEPRITLNPNSLGIAEIEHAIFDAVPNQNTRLEAMNAIGVIGLRPELKARVFSKVAAIYKQQYKNWILRWNVLEMLTVLCSMDFNLKSIEIIRIAKEDSNPIIRYSAVKKFFELLSIQRSLPSPPKTAELIPTLNDLAKLALGESAPLVRGKIFSEIVRFLESAPERIATEKRPIGLYGLDLILSLKSSDHNEVLDALARLKYLETTAENQSLYELLLLGGLAAKTEWVRNGVASVLLELEPLEFLVLATISNAEVKPELQEKARSLFGKIPELVNVLIEKLKTSLDRDTESEIEVRLNAVRSLSGMKLSEKDLSRVQMALRFAVIEGSDAAPRYDEGSPDVRVAMLKALWKLSPNKEGLRSFLERVSQDDPKDQVKDAAHLMLIEMGNAPQK